MTNENMRLVIAQYKAELRELEDQCEAEGYPARGSNYELRADAIRAWYSENYPEWF